MWLSLYEDQDDDEYYGTLSDNDDVLLEPKIEIELTLSAPPPKFVLVE